MRRTIQCTRVADRAFSNGKSLGRNRVIGGVLATICRARAQSRRDGAPHRNLNQP
ncbi:MAG: hypothetical protein JNL58_28580 [Planctomyces sp.]|nr:hypothetical protein [Planctomyces sp.]